MVTLLVTTCVIGLVCKQVESPIAYDDVESCFNQGALIAAQTAATRPNADKYAWRADCETRTKFGDEIGIITISTTGEHGAELPAMFKLDSELNADQEALEAVEDVSGIGG